MVKQKQNILVLTYWSFNDPLIQTYTLPYLKIIRAISNKEIYLLTLEKNKNVQIDVTKIPDGVHLISFNYVPFGLKAFFKWCQILLILIFSIIFSKKIEYIHCWGLPTGVFGILLSKLLSKKLILDSYEPHAESMVENGQWRRNSIAYKILFSFEKYQTKNAKYIISATKGMRNYAQEKYDCEVQDEQFFVKPACVNMNQFRLSMKKDPELMAHYSIQEEDIVMVYSGKFGGIYLEDEVFEFIKVANEFWGEKFKVLIFTGQADYVQEQVLKYQLNNVQTDFIPHHQVPKCMGLGDFGVTPVKPIPTKRYCTPIKDGEYWALGLPIVITKNISDDSDIIEKEGIGYVWKDTSPEEYLKSVQYIDQLLKSTDRRDLSQRIRNIADRYRNYKVAEDIYKTIYS